LEEFTTRNAGRRARLAIDDRGTAEETRERDDAILCVAYDPYGCRVDIVLGDLGNGGRHHVSSIGGVTSVDLLTGITGRDLVLRVAHGRGRVQTLLTLSN